MKVLLVNGSPHPAGCTFTALNEIAAELAKNGVESEFLQLGNQPTRGCIACGGCRAKGSCVFSDPVYDEFVAKLQTADGIIIGSPVYYAGINGSLSALLDRVFFSAGKYLKGKPAAGIVNCRRGGASAAFDRLNKYFTICQMPVISSQYWNSTHGVTPEQTRQDEEGMQTMRVLARNMVYYLKSMEKADLPKPAAEPKIATNFIR